MVIKSPSVKVISAPSTLAVLFVVATFTGPLIAQQASNQSSKPTKTQAALPLASIATKFQPITEIEAFYYWVAIYGAPQDLVDKYARFFDPNNYASAMSDEFERAKYRRKIEAVVLDGADRLTFTERFLYVSERKPHLSARLGEYSFERQAFPIIFPDTGFSYFNYWVGGNGFDINPFDLDKAINLSDFDWSLPMPEEKASVFLKSRPGRTITLAFVYSIDYKKHEVRQLRYYLTPYVHAAEVFTDYTLKHKVATIRKLSSTVAPPLSRDAKLAEDARVAAELKIKLETAATTLAGKWRDESGNTIELKSDGSYTHTSRDKITVITGAWKVEGDMLTLTEEVSATWGIKRRPRDPMHNLRITALGDEIVFERIVQDWRSTNKWTRIQ